MENGCEVLDRPKKYATDQSKSEESLIHFSKNVLHNQLKQNY